MLDRLGPGGQAGGSSRIENFIGFPAGLSGAELATRGVLQMLKFGARIVAPVEVEKLTPAKSPDDLHVLHLDCGAEIRSRVILLALGRSLAATGSRGGRAIYRRGHLLCLHDGRGRSVRRHGCRGRRRGQLGRAGRDVSGRVLPVAHGASCDSPHAGAGHVGVFVEPDSSDAPMWSSMSRRRSKAFAAIVAWKRLR